MKPLTDNDNADPQEPPPESEREERVGLPAPSKPDLVERAQREFPGYVAGGSVIEPSWFKARVSKEEALAEEQTS